MTGAHDRHAETKRHIENRRQREPGRADRVDEEEVRQTDTEGERDRPRQEQTDRCPDRGWRCWLFSPVSFSELSFRESGRIKRMKKIDVFTQERVDTAMCGQLDGEDTRKETIKTSILATEREGKKESKYMRKLPEKRARRRERRTEKVHTTVKRPRRGRVVEKATARLLSLFLSFFLEEGTHKERSTTKSESFLRSRKKQKQS